MRPNSRCCWLHDVIFLHSNSECIVIFKPSKSTRLHVKYPFWVTDRKEGSRSPVTNHMLHKIWIISSSTWTQQWVSWFSAHGPQPPKSKTTILNECKQTNSITIIAPPTRNALFRTLFPEPLANKEATTRRKCKFFDALTRNTGTKSLRHISRECGIGESIGRD